MHRRSKTPERKRRIIKKIDVKNNNSALFLWFIGLFLSGIEYDTNNQKIPLIKVIIYLFLTLIYRYMKLKLIN